MRDLAILCLSSVLLSSTTYAASTHFQNPGTASWGEWQRSDPSSIYVHWEEFDAFVDGSGGTSVLPDTAPDIANIGSDFSVLIANNTGSFITGGGASGNIYSFSDTADFSIAIDSSSAHENLPPGDMRVALQVAFAGTEIDDSSVKLLGSFPFTQKIVLVQADASGEFGGVQNEYLYLWDLEYNNPLPLPLAAFSIDFKAEGSSLSLDAVAIDIGPVSTISSVPLPPAFLLALPCIAGLARMRRHASVS